MKKILPAFVLILVTCAAVAFIYKDRIIPKITGEVASEDRSGRGGGSGRRGRRGGDPNRATPVLAAEVESADVPVYLYGVGTVQPYNAATVRAQVTGRLVEVNFTEGQQVTKGDVLARIDPAPYQAAYDQAVAKKAISESILANAKADLTRYEELAKSNYGSQKQADTQRALVTQSEAQIRQDQAAIDSAKTNLDLTTIRAPFDGRTGLRDVDIGNLVSAGETSGIVMIAQLQPISVLFTLPETYVGELIAAKDAGGVALTASVGGKTVGEGTLEVIDNRIDQSTGTVRMKGTFANEPLTLWPGQFVNIRLHLKTLPDVTVVPATALQQGATGRFVYVVQPENTAKLTHVEVTQEGEEQAVIAKGVAPGERVVTSGFANIEDGSKITLPGQGGEGGAAVSQSGDAAPGAEGEAEPRRPRRQREGSDAGETGSERRAAAPGQGGQTQ